MNLTHHFTLPGRVEENWHLFNDPQRIAPFLPGVRITSSSGDEFAGEVKIKLGPIPLIYQGTGRFTERDRSTGRTVISLVGEDRRGRGTAAATMSARLSATGERTSVRLRTELTLTGLAAEFGSEVIQEVSDKLLEQFLHSFAESAGPVEELSDAAETPYVARRALDDADFAKTEPPADTTQALEPIRHRSTAVAIIEPVKRYAPAALGALTAVLLAVRLVRRRKR